MKDYIKTWDKIAHKFSKGKVDNTHPEQEALLLSELEVGSSVLDVGCATGKHVLFLAKHGFKATGVDLSSEMIKIASGKNKSKNATFALGDATKLDFPNKSFDYVISMGNTLGSIPGEDQRIKALREIIRVARKKVILELVKSNSTKEVVDKYTFLSKNEGYITKRWNENEISDIIKSLSYEPKIKKGRKSLIANYFFYVIVSL